MDLSLQQLQEQVVDHHVDDRETKQETSLALYQKDEEQNQMLGFYLTTLKAKYKVEHRLP